MSSPGGQGEGEGEAGRIWLVGPTGEAKAVAPAPAVTGGLTFSPDGSLLYVADGQSHWVESYQVLRDGSLANRQKFCRLHMPDSADDAGAGGMAVDRDGRLYVATRCGVQVASQTGPITCVLPTPGGGRATGLVLGGPDLDTLFVACGDRVFQRKLRVKGVSASQPPVKRKPPRAATDPRAPAPKSA